MFLLSPQYWLFEAVIIFLLFLAIFRFFCRDPQGRKIARDICVADGPDEVAADAAELRDRAETSLGEAEVGAAKAARTAEVLRKVAGVPEKE